MGVPEDDTDRRHVSLDAKDPGGTTTYSGYPAYEGEQQTTTKEIVYADREVVIWQDEQQRIALRPAPAPQTETTAIGVAAKTQPAESHPSTTEGVPNRVHHFTALTTGNDVKIACSADGKLIAIANGNPTMHHAGKWSEQS